MEEGPSTLNIKNSKLEGNIHEAQRKSSSGHQVHNGLITKPAPQVEDVQRKRQRTGSHPCQNSKPQRKETDIVDRIWHDHDEEQREKKARREEEAKRREQPMPPARDYLPLTINNLKNFKNEDTAISDFINRVGMVDKLLGYKMLLGKAENCGTLGYEKMTEEEIQELSAEWRKTYSEKETVQNQNQRAGPRTPPPKKEEKDVLEINSPDRPRRGPKTPPGSPGCSNLNNEHGTVNKREVIEELAKSFGITPHQVELNLGNVLDKELEVCTKKLKNELLEKFNQQLQNQMEKKPKTEDLSDQMELVSEDSLSIDLMVQKKEESDTNFYHMVIPPPPIPPPMQPPYPYYNAPSAPYQYGPPPPPPPPPLQQPYQQNIMCYPPPPQSLVPNAPPPQIHYQVPPNQPYVPQPSIPTMVLPPVNVPPPPIGVRIDTPMPQPVPPAAQAMPPTAMPPPPIQTTMPPPPLPPQIQSAAPPQVPPASFGGDCWRSGPPVHQPPINPADSWQHQPSHPPPPVTAATVPVSSAPSVFNVQSTLFSALGLHKFPPPPPPPPVPGASNSNPSVPFSSLSALPPPPPPPVRGPSPPCVPLTFVPPPPSNQPSNMGPQMNQSGYHHHHGHNNGRKPQYSQAFSNNF